MEMIPEIRAREKLEEVTVAMYPLMKESSQRSLFQQWLKDAGIGDVEIPPEIKRIPWNQVRNFVGARKRNA